MYIEYGNHSVNVYLCLIFVLTILLVDCEKWTKLVRLSLVIDAIGV